MAALNPTDGQVVQLAREDVDMRSSNAIFTIQLSESAKTKLAGVAQPAMWQMVRKGLVAGCTGYLKFTAAVSRVREDMKELPGGEEQYRLQLIRMDGEEIAKPRLYKYWIEAVPKHEEAQSALPRHDIARSEQLTMLDKDEDETRCANCRRLGHELADCIKTDEAGFVPGCARCNVLDHHTDVCPGFNSHCAPKQKSKELFYHLVLGRGGKPPLRTEKWDWCREAARPSAPALTSYPLFAREALEWSRDNPIIWMVYDYWHDPGLGVRSKVVSKEALVADKTLSAVEAKGGVTGVGRGNGRRSVWE